MNNEALFRTLDRSPVVDLAYQYTSRTVEESYIERDHYVPYSGEMRLADSIFCRGPIIIDSLTREVEYDKVEIPSKICDMLEDKMSFCSERLNNGEVVYISLSYTILDGEVEGAVHPGDGAIEVLAGQESVHLAVGEHVAQFAGPALPVDPVEVAHDIDIHDVVEVNLVYGIHLRGVQIEFVSHFVGQEPCLLASLAVAHCAGHHNSGHCDEGGDKTLHSS